MVAAFGRRDDAGRLPRIGANSMSNSTPVVILAILGAVIAVLGLFIAGNIVMVSVGLLAVFGAGLLDVMATRSVRS
jgi:hypothetical protein